MKLPVRLTYAHASLLSGDYTLWWSEHKNWAKRWRDRAGQMENAELRNIYRNMARLSGQWARQSYDKCVEEYLAHA